MGKKSPQNPDHGSEYEFLVISGLIYDNSVWQKMSFLAADDFINPVCRAAFTAIQALMKKGTPIDFTILSDELVKANSPIRDMSPFATAFTSQPEISLIIEYGLRLKEKSIQRQAALIANQMATKLSQSQEPFDFKLLNQLQANFERVNKLRNPQANYEYKPVDDTVVKQFPQKKWIIEGMVARSTITLLAAQSKTGKTYLGSQLVLCVANDLPVFGKRAVTQGQVLYLVLEENEEGFQATIKENYKALGISKAPNMFVQYDIPRFDEGGAMYIQKWIQEQPNPVLVVIDILEKVRPARTKSIYGDDYKALAELRTLAEQGMAFIITHHTNRGKHTDPQYMISGSDGLTGGVDNFIVMYRDWGQSEETIKLYRKGRSYGKFSGSHIYLTRREKDGSNGVKWLEANQDITQNDERRAILQLMRDGYNMAKDIAEVLDKDRRAVSKLLYTMMKSEPPLVERTGRGIFKLLLGGENELDNCNLESQPDNEKSGLLGLLEEQQNSVYSVYSDDKSLDNKELDNMSSVSDYSESKPSKPVEKVVYSDGLLCSDDKSDSYNEVNQVNRHMYTQSKPLNGKFVPLHKFLTIKRHRDLGLDEFFQNKATLRGSVHDHYYIKFVAAFKNEYKRNAGRVIRKVADEMRKGYPFSQVMAEILDSKEIQKEVRYGWKKIKTRLSGQYGEDELEATLKELIEASFVEHDVQKYTLKLLDN